MSKIQRDNKEIGQEEAKINIKVSKSGQIEDKENDKWGWMVCFGTVITFIAGIGHVNSFGLIYNDFIIDTDSTAKSFTTAHGVFAVMLAVGGIILDMMSKKISLRLGGMFGAIVMITGSFLTVFISDTNQLSLTFGVLQGIGFGMMVPVCYSTLNHYFVRKRTTVMSICKALQGIVLMWYPHLLRQIMIIYGFRGTLLIICGIALHSIPGMLAMKTDFRKKARKIRTANNLEKTKERSENADLLNRIDSNQSTNDNTCHKNVVNKTRNALLEILNLRMLKDPVYCNICIGQSFVNFSDLTFFILQPMLLLQYGYETTQVAICISVCGISDVAGRCVLAVISYFLPINTRVLFYVATLVTLVMRIVMLQVRQFIWIVIVTILLGVLRAWLHVASPLVISNHVSHKDFPGAYALFMLAAGLVNVTVAPLMGQLKDVYHDYVPVFYALTLCCVPCLIFWPLEYLLKKRLFNRNN